MMTYKGYIVVDLKGGSRPILQYYDNLVQCRKMRRDPFINVARWDVTPLHNHEHIKPSDFRV